LLLTSNTKTAQAQLTTEKFELTATIEPPSQIASGTTLSELNFTTDYEVSLLLSFSEETNLTIPQGIISPPLLHQPINASIHDNLGNTFLPIINETTITNPTINNIKVPAFFNYTITLSFKTIDDAQFRNEIGNFVWSYGANQVSVPLSITFRLPKDYTPLQYADGSSKTIDNHYTIFNWNFAQGDNISCFVVFMPFSIEPTIRSMKLTVNIPSYWPPSSSMKQTFEMTFDLPSVVMIWNLSLNIELPMAFPETNFSSIQVESVFDGQGQCEPLTTRPISSTQNSQTGHFFVDYIKGIVFVYPRPSYQDKFEQFYVKVTFTAPSNYTPDESDPKIPFWQPYRGFVRQVFNYTLPTQPPLKWHLNLTDSFEVEVILPPGTESAISEGSQPILGRTEDNRQTATFVYNSPITIPDHEWTVEFDNIMLRNFSVQQLITLFLFALPFVFLVIVNKFSKPKSKLAFLEAFPVAFLAYRVVEDMSQYLTLPKLGGFFLLCAILELILVAIAVGLFLFVIAKKQLRVENT